MATYTPTLDLKSILKKIQNRLQIIRDERSTFDNIVDTLGSVDPWGLQEKEFEELSRLDDSPDNRRKAASLLSALGENLPEVPENLRHDEEYNYSKEITPEKEVEKSVTEALEVITPGASKVLTVIAVVVGILAGVVTILAFLRIRPKQKNGDE